MVSQVSLRAAACSSPSRPSPRAPHHQSTLTDANVLSVQEDALAHVQDPQDATATPTQGRRRRDQHPPRDRRSDPVSRPSSCHPAARDQLTDVYVYNRVRPSPCQQRPKCPQRTSTPPFPEPTLGTARACTRRRTLQRSLRAPIRRDSRGIHRLPPWHLCCNLRMSPPFP